MRDETRKLMLSAMKKLVSFSDKRDSGRTYCRKVVREGLPVQVMSK